jgi:hypothetical protein
MAGMSPWVRRALTNTLPAKDFTGHSRELPSADELIGEPGTLTVVDVRTGEAFRVDIKGDWSGLEDEAAALAASSFIESLE